jgi:hypothetical protein
MLINLIDFKTDIKLEMEWVIAPTEMKSTPVFGYFYNVLLIYPPLMLPARLSRQYTLLP